MFTGIIEEIGIIKQMRTAKNLTVVDVQAKKILSGVKPGDSVAVNGVCLTVTKCGKQTLSFDLMKETLSATSLGECQKGDLVNLERAMKWGDRLGGHFVTGHVDGVLRIKRIVKEKNYVEFQFDLNGKMKKHVVVKGSISIDGVSLTIGRVTKRYFSVYLIPFTLRNSNLGMRSVGDRVNVETDILAKYGRRIPTKFGRR